MAEGTIRQREIKDVYLDILREARIPASTYAFRGGDLHLLSGTQAVKLSCKANQSFWAVEANVRRLREYVEEISRRRANRQQVDLEEAIAARS